MGCSVSFDPDRIRVAVANGVSPVCATCKHYWQGRAQGLPGSQCTAKSMCASPLANDTYSCYDGPIRDGHFAQWCFRCGADSDYAIRVNSRRRVIGVCKDHLGMFTKSPNLRPTAVALHPERDVVRPATLEVLSKHGPPVLLDKLRAQRKPSTLREILAEEL